MVTHCSVCKQTVAQYVDIRITYFIVFTPDICMVMAVRCSVQSNISLVDGKELILNHLRQSASWFTGATHHGSYRARQSQLRQNFPMPRHVCVLPSRL